MFCVLMVWLAGAEQIGGPLPWCTNRGGLRVGAR